MKFVTLLDANIFIIASIVDPDPVGSETLALILVLSVNLW
jgi:hypothetical protein